MVSQGNAVTIKKNIYHRYIKFSFHSRNLNGQMSKELSVKNKKVVVNTLT